MITLFISREGLEWEDRVGRSARMLVLPLPENYAGVTPGVHPPIHPRGFFGSACSSAYVGRCG